MPALRWFVSIGISAALFVGGFAAPVSADQAARSGDPDIVSLQERAEDVLRGTVRSARATYAAEIKTARAQRASGLAGPKAELAAALKLARTKAERRVATRAYDRTAAPVKQEYRAAKQSALAKRNATIDEALATYLVTTGKPAIAEALEAYLAATAIAGDTLELALKSGRDTLKTDTADERAQLVTDLEDATTESERTRRGWTSRPRPRMSARPTSVRSPALGPRTPQPCRRRAGSSRWPPTCRSEAAQLPFTI